MFHNKTLPNELKDNFNYMSIGRIAVTVFTTAVKRDLIVEAHKRTDGMPPLGFNHGDLAATFFDDLQTTVTTAFAQQYMLVGDALNWVFEQSYVDQDNVDLQLANASYIKATYGAFKRIGKDKERELGLSECQSILDWFRNNYVVIVSTPIAVTEGALLELDPIYTGIHGGRSKFA